MTGTVAVTGVTDSQGNTYTRTGTSSGSACCEQWAALLTTGLTHGIDTIAIARAGGTRIEVIIRALPGSGTVQGVASDWNYGTAIANISPPYLVGYPIIQFATIFGDAPVGSLTFTPSGGWTLVATQDLALYEQQRLCDLQTIYSPAIHALTEWVADETKTLTGTVSTSIGSTQVTGSGTSFNTPTVLMPGDRLLVGGEIQTVQQIDSATVLQTYAAWSTSNSGATAYSRSGPRIYTSSRGNLLKGHNTLGLGWYAPKTGLHTANRAGIFVSAGRETTNSPRKLVFFNGYDTPQVITGDDWTAHDIATPPADWTGTPAGQYKPVNGIVHQSRLVAFGNMSSPHRVYLSDPTNHEVFTGASALQFNIASHIGQRLWCAVQYRGRLLLWKHPQGIFYFDDTEPDYTTWSIRTLSESLGCAPSPHAAVETDDDVIFMSPDGHLHILSAVDTLGGTANSDLTRRLRLEEWTATHINVAGLSTLSSAYDWRTKTVYFGVSTTGGGNNDLLLMLNLGGSEPRFSYATGVRPNALAMATYTSMSSTAFGPLPPNTVTYVENRPTLLIGEESMVFVRYGDEYGYRRDAVTDVEGVVDVNAVTYPVDVWFQPLDCSSDTPLLRTRRKAFQAIELVYSNAVALDPLMVPWVLECWVDDVLRETVSVPQLANRRRVLLQLSCGDGYDLQLRLTRAQQDTLSLGDAPLIGAIVYYAPLGHDQSRTN